MACTVNTPSINLSTSGGVLSAVANISAPAATVAPNPLSIASDGLFVDGSDGWIGLPSALAYSSTTSSGDASCFVVTSSVDVRAFLSPGMKVMLVHGGVTKFFVVVAVAAGTITLWAGSAYTLAAGAITVPFFSPADLPAGFPDLPTTAPPAVAYEGMTVTWIADAANGIEYTIKFRTAEATYKWRVIGGPPMTAVVATGQNVQSAAYVDLGTVGPSIALPRAGDWIFAYSCQSTAAGAGNVTEWVLMAYALSGGTTYAAADADAAATMAQIANFGLLPVTASMPSRPHTGIVTGTTVTAKYRNNNATTITVANRRIAALPVRII